MAVKSQAEIVAELTANAARMLRVTEQARAVGAAVALQEPTETPRTVSLVTVPMSPLPQNKG